MIDGGPLLAPGTLLQLSEQLNDLFFLSLEVLDIVQSLLPFNFNRKLPLNTVVSSDPQ